MKIFWKIQSDIYLNQRCYVESCERVFDMPPSYYEIASVVEEYEVLTFQADCKVNSNPDFFWHGGMPIVSNRFKDLFEAVEGVDVEFLRANLVDNEKRLIAANPYWFMHFLIEIDCIDFKNSDLDFWNSQTHLIEHIRKLKFDEEKIKDLDLFRPRGCMLVFISDRLKRIMDSENFVIDFISSENVRL